MKWIRYIKAWKKLGASGVHKKSLTLLGVVLTVALLAGQYMAYATFEWDTSTQVVLSQQAIWGPVLVYSSVSNKFFIVWEGTDQCCHSLNFISSADLKTWGSATVTGLTAGSWASCDTPLDMTYDSSNGNMYIVYNNVQASTAGKCLNYYLRVFHTSDGSTLSSESLVASSSSYIGSPSITYDSARNQFVLATTDEYNTGHVFVYTSQDGVSWGSSQTVVVGSNELRALGSQIRFINGNYYLSYIDTSRNIRILRSSDANTWSAWSSPPQTTYGSSPSLSYDPAEGWFHLNWQGTDNGINDAISSDAQTWGSPTTFQSTQAALSLDYTPNAQTLLMAWAGTNCLSCGNLNVMQYYNVVPEGGGGGGGGSVAYGSLITMADGTQVPIQNVRVGDQVVVYNVPTGYETVGTVEQVIVTVANSSITLHTTVGLPFRADANPHMRLWVETATGPVETPITNIQSGDKIYNYDLQSWVTVTHVTLTYGGQHTVFDLITNPNHTTTGQVLEYVANGYPDCSIRGCKV